MSRSRPTSVFVEVIIRSDRGQVKDLESYADAASGAVMRLATKQHIFCGVVRRRKIVASSTLDKHMQRHGFYGKVRE